MSTPLDPKDLHTLAHRLLTQGPYKTYPAAPRRIRIVHGGEYIADTTRATFVWEHDKYPFYYIPRRDIISDEDIEWSVVDEVRVGGNEATEGEIGARIWKVDVGSKSTERVVEFLNGELGGLWRVEFGAVDQWFEEDTPILVHPKDPFKRITCLPSTRPVSISLGPVHLATSPFSVHLFETGLPCRYYVPFTSIPQQILRKSETRSVCPYKGEAEYYDIVLPEEDRDEDIKVEGGKKKATVYKDLVWYYNRPNVEVAAVQGLACFFNEKVDVEVGGEKQERPKTPFG